MHPKGAYFTRGSGHNRFGGYTEDADEYIGGLDRIDRKIQQRGAGRAGADRPDGSRARKLGLVTVGGCHAACIEALDLLAQEGIALDYMRVRGFPFGDEVRRVPRSRTTINFVVEQNRDAQLRSLLMLETGVPIEKLESVRYYGGFPMSAHHVITGVKAEAGEGGMTYIAKPKVHHPALQKNAIGLTRRDYEGAITTLCAGCGHDSITAAIIQAFWELSIPPHKVAQAVGHRLLVEDAGLFPARGARLQRRARPHAGAGHRRQRRQPRHHLHRHVRATATRCRSASASCVTPSAATSTCSTCSRTTASTA